MSVLTGLGEGGGMLRKMSFFNKAIICIIVLSDFQTNACDAEINAMIIKNDQKHKKKRINGRGR